MHSYEVLREAADSIGVKALAAQLRLSPALVYKWCQGADPDDPDASGARNPLDRLREIVSATQSTKVVNWLCHEAGGFYVVNPTLTSDSLDAALLANTQKLVEEFSRLLSTVTRSIEDDGKIDPGEADRIRLAWESLKSTVETFAVACERGLFHSTEEPDG
ncbi:MAG: phage regulatory CII family protein [Phycisphaerae bacterium]